MTVLLSLFAAGDQTLQATEVLVIAIGITGLAILLLFAKRKI